MESMLSVLLFDAEIKIDKIMIKSGFRIVWKVLFNEDMMTESDSVINHEFAPASRYWNSTHG